MNRSELSEPVRRSLVRLPVPHQAHYGVVPAALPEAGIILGDVARLHGRAMEALGRAQVLAEGMGDAYAMTRLLTQKEAISSSAVEGTFSTLDELLASADGEVGEETKPAVRQVRSYAKILSAFARQAERTGPEIFSVRLIQRLHRRVMQDDPAYRDEPGSLRQVSVWIGSVRLETSTFNPPPADRVEACLGEHVDYLQAKGLQAQTQSLITRMALAHAHFEAIHPFRDGNGRVGRLLLPLMMAAEGYAPLYLAAHIEANRADYYRALKASQQRLEWEAMIGFLSQAVISTVDEVQTTFEALARLQAIWRGRARFRGKSAAERALAHLAYQPVVSVKRLAKELGISFTAAARAVDQLMAAGILVERTGFSRNRLFAAPEALAVLNRAYGDQPDLPEA